MAGKPTKTENPIPFNPATMTASQLFDCAEQLSQIFHAVERGDAPAILKRNIMCTRDALRDKWSSG